MNSLLDSALDYARRGLRVIPLHCPIFDERGNVRCSCGDSHTDNPKRVGKHPRPGDWLTAATTDSETITRWWQDWPDANIGIVPAGSGFYVVDTDIDEDKNGEQELFTVGGDVPPTWTARTGSGGRHRYFTTANSETLPKTQNRIGKGVDTFGAGGLVVAPPSLHYSGNRYTWEPGAGPGHVQPAPLPGWLVELVQADDAGRPTVDSGDYGQLPPGSARPGEGDATADIHARGFVSGHVRSLIMGGATCNQDDQTAVNALITRALSDGKIADILNSYPIGERIRQKHKFSDYVPRTIAAGRKHLENAELRPYVPADEYQRQNGNQTAQKSHLQTTSNNPKVGLSADKNGTSGKKGGDTAPPVKSKPRTIKGFARGGVHSTLTVPAGGYLELKPDELPPRFFLNAATGIGKSTAAETFPGAKVIACSTVAAVKQAADRNPAAAVTYGDKKDYTAADKFIICTYNQLPRVVQVLGDAVQWFTLFVDEYHNLALADYKQDVLNGIYNALGHDWRRVILMSGTPQYLYEPAVADFQDVNVRSYQRQQKAVRVVWRDEEGKGTKLEAVAAAVERHGDSSRHIFLLNSKRDEEELGRLKALLMARFGVTEREIAPLNSITLKEEEGGAILNSETVPEHKRFVICTTALVESVNLRTTFDAAHVVSDYYPAYSQQFVNRMRTAAPGVVYWYNVGDKRGYSPFDKDGLRQTAEAAKQQLLDYQTTVKSVLSESGRAVLWANAPRSARRDGSAWKLDYCGVTLQFYRHETERLQRNPRAFKRYLTGYGWQWGDDLALVVEQRTEEAKEIHNRLEREAVEKYRKLVDECIRRGEKQAKVVHQKTRYDSERKVLERALELVDLLRQLGERDAAGELPAGDVWNEQTRALLYFVGTSSKAYARLKRSILAQLERDTDGGEPSPVQYLYALIEPGNEYTSEQAQELVKQAFDLHPETAAWGKPRRYKHYSEELTSKLTKTYCTQLIKALFQVKRVRQTDDDGTRSWAYRVVNDNPVKSAIESGSKLLKSIDESAGRELFTVGGSGESPTLGLDRDTVKVGLLTA